MSSHEAQGARFVSKHQPLNTAQIIHTARGLRAFGDGFIALLLPAYFVQIGLGAFEVGVFTTASWM